MQFDLLSTVTYGGCSAKISAQELSEALKDLPEQTDEHLLVDISTHDDAGIYRLDNKTALIQTTDFFPPVCSDPEMFGKIAAANALSDVYAMGGKALTALNIVCFPSKKIPLDVLSAILSGGQEKVSEAGAVIVGGHTIDDYPPKYGLAVTGIVHPEKLVTNAAARPGDVLCLTKALGTGIIIAGKRIDEVADAPYQAALFSMQQLNNGGAEVMQEFSVRCATDITGFSLLGHAAKMAVASGVTLKINSQRVPLLDGAYELAEMGCLPGACFRNQEFVQSSVTSFKSVDYNRQMCMFDAQTSGGLLMCLPEATDTQALLQRLRGREFTHASIIGEVIPSNGYAVELV